MKQYELVLFDFDGTLSDSFQWFISAINSAAQKFHFHSVSPSDIEIIRSLSTSEILKKLNIKWWKRPLVIRFMKQEMGKQLSSIKLFPDADKMLMNLINKGIKIGILSSNSKQNIQTILGDDLNNQIKIYECDVSLFGKASRLKSVAKKYKVPPAKMLYIGDELRDIEAARKAKCHIGIVSWGYHSQKTLLENNPNYSFKTFAEIEDSLN